MSLLISIIGFPENCAVSESSKTFGEQGGTIGRSVDNYWVLNDPDCFLSSRHSEIAFEGGHYILTDISTNGTFLNGSREPMGKGNKVQLQDGDEIELSDYKFSIKLLQSNPIINNEDPFSNEDILSGSASQSNFMSTDPFSTGEIESVESLLNSESQVIDPLVALDNIKSERNQSVFNSDFSNSQSSQSDQSHLLGQSLIWPETKLDENVIPDGWDMDEDIGLLEEVGLVEEVVRPKSNTMVDAGVIVNLRSENLELKRQLNHLRKLKEENVRMQSEIKRIKKQFLAYQKNNKITQHDSLDTTMITTMGLPTNNLTKSQILAINRVAGEMIKKTVAGMMQVLTSRNSIKNEFRMNVTTIQPVENNPLKFSANVSDALENMFLKSGSSYKKPLEAVTDGFHGIAEHQVAIIAGMRAAFKGSIKRFDPNFLVKRFDRQQSGYFKYNLLFKKTRNWNQFVDYYNDLVNDMDNSFQYLFGDDFVKAYEEQLKSLVISRKSKKVN